MALRTAPLPAKQLDDLCGLPSRKIGKGQNLNILNLGNALIHVLIQKDTQNRLRFGRILAEEVFFLHLAGRSSRVSRFLPYAT